MQYHGLWHRQCCINRIREREARWSIDFLSDIYLKELELCCDSLRGCLVNPNPVMWCTVWLCNPSFGISGSFHYPKAPEFYLFTKPASHGWWQDLVPTQLLGPLDNGWSSILQLSVSEPGKHFPRGPNGSLFSRESLSHAFVIVYPWASDEQSPSKSWDAFKISFLLFQHKILSFFFSFFFVFFPFPFFFFLWN